LPVASGYRPGLTLQRTKLLVLHGCVRLCTPLLPATQKHFDLRVASLLQGKRLDRGPSPGLSAGYGRLIGRYPPLTKQFPQLLAGFEPSILGQQFFPRQMLGIGDMSAPQPSNLFA
jgi:hypothetical protein